MSGDNFKPIKEFPLGPTFQSAGGYSWLSSLPEEVRSKNTKHRKAFRLYEDGKELGEGNNTMHVDIQTKGGGLNSFWTDAFCFSTSDNSDPNTNGRSYILVQLIEAPIGIWPFAGCTLYNPVYALEDLGTGYNAARQAAKSNSIYTHTPGEHLQFIDFLRGVREISTTLQPICNIVFERANDGFSASLEDTDFVLIELCSDVEIVFRGTILNRLRLVDAILEPAKKLAASDVNFKSFAQAAGKWYFDGLLKESPGRMEYAETILKFHADQTDEDKLLRTIVAETYPRKISLETMVNEVRQIQSILGKPVGVATHTQHYMPDGRPLSWPPSLHGQIFDSFKKAGIAVLHPCDLVAQYGAKTVLKDDLIHWHDDFMPVIGRHVHEFAQRILAANRAG